MLENIGKLKSLIKKKRIKIPIHELEEGTKFYENFIIYKKNENIRIFSRLCDHRGGKIISKNGESLCPIHNWKFEPSKGSYQNGVKKKEINCSYNKNNIEINIDEFTPIIKKTKKIDKKTSLRFFNHAFLKIYGDDFSFITDPWAIGPSFNTGWWLKYNSKIDWIENLNKSSFVYISHNHPDHLHPLTLSKLNKNKLIVVPKFKTDSAGIYLEELGFKNVVRLEFSIQYRLKGTDLIICLFKSGDFREDSGMYFSNGNFSGLLSVDSNLINFERYPKVDIYASSFAGGASGYPLMFENYSHKEKVEIVKKDRLFFKSKLFKTLRKINPKYFLPYAGFFQEKLPRDSMIKKENHKNTIEDYQNFCLQNDIKLLNVAIKDLYVFKGKKLLLTKNVKKPFVVDLAAKKYLEYFKSQYSKLDDKYIQEYFINSGFHDNLNLYISLTNDKFESIGNNYFIDFSQKKIIFKKILKIKDLKPKNYSEESPRILLLKVRKESFLNTLYNKAPWEDLLIGFQAKIFRYPNTYNVDFWHHFTNVYTQSKNVRAVTNCGACEKIGQFFDNQIYKIKTL